MKTAATIVICLFFSSLIYGQGSIPMNKKSFIGALEFLPNGKLAEGYPRVKSAYPMHIDPVIDPKNWYVENNQQMSGMLGDAVLFIEWWTKATSPSERYKFDWTSSGYFEVNYVNDKGENKYQRIDRYKLEKYPNLVQRFDNITPIDINFEITFHAGSRPDKEYYAFRKRYNIMEDLGSAGYAVNYTRKLNGDFILYKPSRKKQDWINPGIVQGGWNTFLNMPDKYKDKESRLIELFKMGTTLEISSFRVSNIKWRMSDFIYIAKKYEDYETGKDKPTAFDEVANGEQENKAGDGFWDETDLMDNEIEPFYENGKGYGIRTKKEKILVNPIYEKLESTKQKGIFIAKTSSSVIAINSRGNILDELKGDYRIYQNGIVVGEFEGRESQPQYDKYRTNWYWIRVSKGYEIKNNKFVFTNNYVQNAYHANAFTSNGQDVYQIPNTKMYFDNQEHSENYRKAKELYQRYLDQGYLPY
ncbi:MAG: hypothetical protein ACI83B_002459 [Sediminicola sp.]|jgi:hypothetical protein